jgi:DNA modification methylase
MTVKIHIGDCREILKGMTAGSVHSVITSPPYWGLRDYMTVATIWGGDEKCEHVWGSTLPEHHKGQVNQTKWKDCNAISDGQTSGAGQFCLKCSAWIGHLGLEPTPQLFVDHLVEVMRGVWRVLRDDGVLWLNLGDSYGHGTSAKRERSKTSKKISEGQHIAQGGRHGGQSKQLLGIPWRVALALQADGWWWRQWIPWVKRNSMPESCKDRPNSSIEIVHVLTKDERYFFDMEAAKAVLGLDRHWRNGDALIFDIPTNGYSEAHFATFPPDLVKPMIAAGTSERGCCPDCGASWVRVVRTDANMVPRKTDYFESEPQISKGKSRAGSFYPNRETLGWKPTCTCNAGDPIPCTVLDPFMGAGTTLLQADRMGRDARGIELNETYARDLAYPRIAGDAPMFSDVEII